MPALGALLADALERTGREGTDTEVVHRIRRNDGALRLVRTRGFAVRDAEGEIYRVVGFVEDITERKRAEEALKERLHFEQLISDLSARLINLPSEKLDGEIEDALKVVLEFFQVDRCALLHIIQGRDAWKITHLASSQFAPPIPVDTVLPRSIHPWAYNRLANRGEVVLFSKVDDMPDEARVDKQTWRDWGIRSNLVIPLFLDKTIVYIIAINTVQKERDWPKEFIPRLRLLGEIFVGALERRKADQALRESEKQLSLAAASAEAGIWVIYADTGRTRWHAIERSKGMNHFTGKRGHWAVAPTYSAGRVFSVGTTGRLYAYHAKTGKRRWYKVITTKGKLPALGVAPSGDVQVVWIEGGRLTTAARLAAKASMRPRSAFGGSSSVPISTSRSAAFMCPGSWRAPIPPSGTPVPRGSCNTSPRRPAPWSGRAGCSAGARSRKSPGAHRGG